MFKETSSLTVAGFITLQKKMRQIKTSTNINLMKFAYLLANQQNRQTAAIYSHSSLYLFFFRHAWSLQDMTEAK